MNISEIANIFQDFVSSSLCSLSPLCRGDFQVARSRCVQNRTEAAWGHMLFLGPQTAEHRQQQCHRHHFQILIEYFSISGQWMKNVFILLTDLGNLAN